MKIKRLIISDNIFNRVELIKNLFYNKLGGKLYKSNTVDIDSCVIFADKEFKKHSLDLLMELNELVNFLVNSYKGQVVRGNIRYIKFVLSKNNIEKYFLYKKDLLFIPLMRDAMESYIKIRVNEYDGINSKESTDWNEKREALLSIFLSFIERQAVVLDDYFKWFFNVFLNSQKGATAGFWFSLSVVGGYVAYIRQEKKSSQIKKYIEKDY